MTNNLFSTAFVACGSNIGDPKKELLNAYEAMHGLPLTKLEIISPFYLSKPQGDIPQADIVNSVVKLSTQLDPYDLLAALQTIEVKQGRDRLIKWGPRTLDLDIVLFENIISSDPTLTLPHKYLYQRDFVLKPLMDIAPDLILPNGKRIDIALNEVTSHIIEKII